MDGNTKSNTGIEFFVVSWVAKGTYLPIWAVERYSEGVVKNLIRVELIMTF